MKQPEHSYDADRSENRNNYFGKLAVCANVEHIPILWPSTSAPVWRHTFQNCMHMFTKVPVCQHQNIYVIPKKYNVSASTIHISPNLETTQLSTEKWINNLCSIQTMAHYNNESVSEGRVTPGACLLWVLVVLRFLTRMLVLWVPSLRGSSLSCTLRICIHFGHNVILE